MWGARGGCRIQRTGTPGTYAYNVDNNHANRPVNYVDFWAACRFANWLTNNQPIGSQDANSTEDGSYYLNGYIGTDGHTIVRKQQGRFFVPSQDEWYKSAYHKNDGVTANYWDYQTQGNTAPVSQLPPGVAEPSGSANYNAVDQVNGITEVGAYTLSPSAYDTFDQGGNVWEWDEQVMSTDPNFPDRQLRGGGFLSVAGDLRANTSIEHLPNFEDEDIGFRIVEVPEPATLSLLAIGGLATLRRRSGQALRRRSGQVLIRRGAR
jgi:formylglycine-generating enzyme required for sulfatase activity